MVGGFSKTILSTLLKDLPEEMFLFLFHIVTQLGWHLELHSHLAISWKVSFRMALTPTRELGKDLIWILLRDGSILDREVTKGSPWLPHAFAGAIITKPPRLGSCWIKPAMKTTLNPVVIGANRSLWKPGWCGFLFSLLSTQSSALETDSLLYISLSLSVGTRSLFIHSISYWMLMCKALL